MNNELNVEMVSVDSSNIKSIGFLEEKSELYVTFKNNKKYVYYNATIDLYNSFLNSDSKGKFFAKEIKPFLDYKQV